MDLAEFGASAEREKEVRVVVPGTAPEVRTPIWIVNVKGTAYVRSYKAGEGHWYQNVREASRFVLEIAGTDVAVVAEPVADADLLAEVSDAYRTKYAGEAETPDMVADAVAATTLRLTPT